MKSYENDFDNIVKGFKEFDEVEAIALGGSRASGTNDAESDYDLYIYLNKILSVEKRRGLLNKYLTYTELNNTTWELEDQGIFANGKVYLDIVYRDLNFIEGHLDALVNKNQASTGYTTAIWYNFDSSKLLFDRNGSYAELRSRYNMEVPEELVEAIIEKNYPLLGTIIPSYKKQIIGALKRRDYVSINHRISAFLESYFDIIFAINRKKHPGEKRLLRYLKNLKAPTNAYEDIELLLTNKFEDISKVEDILDNICLAMKEFLEQEGYLFNK